MSRLKRHATALSGLEIVERAQVADDRGRFARIFCAQTLGWFEGGAAVHQVNHSITRLAGTVRGMHYQRPPYTEMKLVTCIRGAVHDVAVDLRSNSPTFLAHHAEELSDHNCRALMIPQGFAHGFQALTADATLLYIHSAAYTAEAEAGVHALDPVLKIEWPLPVVQMSARDRGFGMIDTRFQGIQF